MSNTFCPIPWNFQAVRNNGDIRVCCQANVTENQGVVRHEDGTPYNAGRDNMELARNATLMKEIRKNMLVGEWSQECGRCKQEEDSGLNSRRQYELDNWKFSIDDARYITEEDGTIKDKKLEYYDLRFGNLCNLACRMCGPTDSHTWYEQWADYHGSEEYKDTHGTVKLTRNENGRLTTSDYDWHNSETFWTQMETNIPNIKHVYMAGGEPMMIERHYEFLQKCIDLGHAGNMVLEYNTNMSNLPNRVLDMWTKFKQVRVGASMDGMGETVEYQRWPLKWSQAYKNLQKLDEYAEKNPNIMAWLACTVTAYNVWHIPRFMKWKLQSSGFTKINSTKKRPIITHHVAHGPKRANVRVLPADMKQEIVEYYARWIAEFKMEYPEDIANNAQSILNSITKYMLGDDYSNHLPEFVKFTKYLDKARGHSILDIAPEYERLFMSTTMRIEISQGDVVIDIPKHQTNIGIRISGGADSSMLLYLLAIFKRDCRPDIKIHPTTIVNSFKPYQEIFSRRVISKVTELTGVEIEDLFAFNEELLDMTKFAEMQTQAGEIWYRQKKLDTHVMGETKNPPLEVDEILGYTGKGRDLTRDGLINDPELLKKRPFRNIDKKGVAELYKKFDLLETLYPITRSCEIHTTDFSKHCEECWFCKEREWGFGRYV